MIIDKIESRELFTLDAGGIDLRGTYHKPDEARARYVGATGKHRTGIVFANALSTPRSGNGDSVVYWASAFAGLGYPSFRLDLPGLGDSRGEIPNDLIAFIYQGGYSLVFARKLNELAERYNVAEFVIAGHCTGSTNAVYAASENAMCKGLILLDPYFSSPRAISGKIPPAVMHWVRKNRAGVLLRATYDRLREVPIAIRERFSSRESGLDFIFRWKSVASTGMPILVFRAPRPQALGGDKPNPSSVDYLDHLSSLTRGRSRLTIHEIEGSDHSFANLNGRTKVLAYSESWLNRHFSMAEEPASALVASN
jgi:pimeloyl-ACP methyl ester carboxylesterase